VGGGSAETCLQHNVNLFWYYSEVQQAVPNQKCRWLFIDIYQETIYKRMMSMLRDLM